MGVAKNSNETVQLIPALMHMNQQTDMNMFQITLWDLNYDGNYNKLRVLIVMRRKILSEIMTTYFPSILLLAITFATTFFKPFFFEAALSVNLTTMLVMTTIFISKMESLPPTSAIKMIDFWLVICQMVPFAEVVLLTAMEFQRKEDGDVTKTRCVVQVLPVNEEGSKKKNWLQNCRVSFFSPDLKTLGKISNILA